MGLIFPSEFVLFSALQILMSTQSAEDLAKMQILEEWSLKICISKRIPFLFLFLFFFFFFLFFRATPSAHGGSQARGLIRAVATGLCKRHSNRGSELLLRPILQLRAMSDS